MWFDRIQNGDDIELGGKRNFHLTCCLCPVVILSWFGSELEGVLEFLTCLCHDDIKRSSKGNNTFLPSLTNLRAASLCHMDSICFVCPRYNAFLRNPQEQYSLSNLPNLKGLDLTFVRGVGCPRLGVISSMNTVCGVLWPGCSLVGALRPQCASQQRAEGGDGAYLGWAQGEVACVIMANPLGLQVIPL